MCKTDLKSQAEQKYWLSLSPWCHSDVVEHVWSPQNKFTFCQQQLCICKIRDTYNYFSSMYVCTLISWDSLLICSNVQLGRINSTTQETLLGWAAIHKVCYPHGYWKRTDVKTNCAKNVVNTEYCMSFCYVQSLCILEALGDDI